MFVAVFLAGSQNIPAALERLGAPTTIISQLRCLNHLQLQEFQILTSTADLKVASCGSCKIQQNSFTPCDITTSFRIS